MGSYVGRGDLGVVRASASVGHGIALGYVLAIASLLYLALAPSPGKAFSRWTGSGILTVGLLVALSRGPWVGMAIGVVVFAAMSAHRLRDLSRILVWGGVFFGLVLVSPYGEKLLNLLPFVGTTDAFNVDYRRRLLEASILVIQQHPLFGGGDYMGGLAAQGLVQGEGIVDIVNTYLAVALSQGLVGLGLFVGIFVAAGIGLLTARRQAGQDPGMRRLGSALLAALVAALVIISSMSPILCVPTAYWLLAGLCVAYTRLPKPSTVGALPVNKAFHSFTPLGHPVPM
jgi:hypothetical protein